MVKTGTATGLITPIQGIMTTDKGVEIIGVLRLVRALFPYHAADGKLSVLATDGAPDFAESSFAGDLRTCYEKARGEALSGNGGAEYGHISMSINGNDEDADGRPLTVTLKIPIPSGYDADSLRVYRVTADGADYMFTSCATENGRKFVVFETDVMSPIMPGLLLTGPSLWALSAVTMMEALSRRVALPALRLPKCLSYFVPMLRLDKEYQNLLPLF